MKTNCARLLDKAGIPYRLLEYRFDPENLAATHVAEALNEDINQVYKTLVLHGDKTGYFVCVIPGNREVDLKKAARASGNKKSEMIPMRDLLGVTGYIRGGCSPIGMKKHFPTFIQPDCLHFDEIFISAGVRGTQIALHPRQLIAYTGATVADIAKTSDDS